MLSKLKERVQSWIAAEAELAHRVGFTPNQLSAMGVAFATASAFLYWKWRLHVLLNVAAPLFLLASGFCDMLDGALARLYGQTTAFGGFLDSLLDRYSEALIFGGIILSGLCDPFWGLVALVGSLLVSYTRARAEAAGVKMEAVGIAERAERLIILAAASFITIVWREALGLGVIVLAVLTNLTVLQRMLKFHRASVQKESGC